MYVCAVGWCVYVVYLSVLGGYEDVSVWDSVCSEYVICCVVCVYVYDVFGTHVFRVGEA